MTIEPGFLLVVDDDEPNRDMLSRRLRKRGYQVEVAEDGTRALAMLGDGPARFHLVVLDIMMPGLNGLEVLEILRRERSPTDLPVIMATARDQSEDVVRALELGANDYVTKPLDFPVALARIETHLALKRAVDESARLERRLAERNRDLEKANARMIRDLHAAARVQGNFLPREPPPVPGASFAWVFRPCEELAGDGLNVFPIDDQRVGLYVLDVSGHGVASALLSVSVVRALAPPSERATILTREGGGLLAPAEVAAELNRRFPFDVETGQYFTIHYGVLDVASGTFGYVSAGQPGPVVLSPGGKVQVMDGRGYPIGLAEGPYEGRDVRLGPGDRLILYSDGIPEAVAPDGRMFGEARFLDALRRGRDRPLDACLDAVRQEVEDWCGEVGPRDDISLLAVEIAREPAEVPAGADDVPREP
jgi:sigma-B regulation protein RsbU (phosphoserine phosphatase)